MPVECAICAIEEEEEEGSQERGESYRYPPRVAADTDRHTYIHGGRQRKGFRGGQAASPTRHTTLWVRQQRSSTLAVNEWGDIRLPQLEDLVAQSLQAIEAIEAELKRDI